MAQIRTQTLLVLDDSEKEVFKDASTGKLLQNAVKPLQESLKEHAKSLAAMSKGSPNEDDLKAADAAVTELKGLLTSLLRARPARRRTSSSIALRRSSTRRAEFSRLDL
ncbi:hypothetical protein GCM10020255_020570 [Rhodococcus baikonurensis]